jgi:energy-coupling factor transporter ATP-binding protein EcfA2
MTNGPLAIETRALRKEYGPTLAVEALDLTIQPGEVFGSLGPNGAGKSTSVKMLLDLVHPTSGEARLFGLPAGVSVERMFELARSRRRRGYKPQRTDPDVMRRHHWLWPRQQPRYADTNPEERDLPGQESASRRSEHPGPRRSDQSRPGDVQR